MSERYTDQIVELKFDLFDKVQNVGGRASCQDDFVTFQIMRGAQFDAWNEAMRESYLHDLETTTAQGRNLVLEKYAYMSGYSYMGEEEGLAEKQILLREITAQMYDETVAMHERYPNLARRSRPLGTDQGGVVSADHYLLCELMTYSVETLRRFRVYLMQLKEDGKSLPLMILENTALRYGYASLEDAEKRCG